MTYRLIVPRSGRWHDWQGEPEEKTDAHWGPNPHIDQKFLEIDKSAYDVSGYRVRDQGTHHFMGSSTTGYNGKSLTDVATSPTCRPSNLASWITGSPAQHIGPVITPTADPLQGLMATKSPRPDTQLTTRSIGRVKSTKTLREQTRCSACRRSSTNSTCDGPLTVTGKPCSRCSRLHKACRL